jgi:hypothetical protein
MIKSTKKTKEKRLPKIAWHPTKRAAIFLKILPGKRLKTCFPVGWW